MLFNKDILFIHIGKTGGTSVKEYLRQTLPKPVYFVRDEVSLERLRENKVQYIKKKISSYLEIEKIIIADPHCTLAESKKILSKFGFNINDFKLIIVVIRNPLEIELSLYSYLRTKRFRDRVYRSPKSYDAFIYKHGINNSFEEFVKKGLYHRPVKNIEDYFLINNKIPKNLILIKLEEIKEILPKALAIFQVKNKPFPHINSSKRQAKKEILPNEVLEVIYSKYKWFYDKGYYPQPNF